MSASNQVIDNDTPLLEESSLVTPPVNYDLGARPDGQCRGKAGVLKTLKTPPCSQRWQWPPLFFFTFFRSSLPSSIPGPALAHCGHHNGLRSCKILSSDVSLFTPSTSHLCLLPGPGSYLVFRGSLPYSIQPQLLPLVIQRYFHE